MAETTKYLDDLRSLELLDSLTKNLNFNIPNVDFNDSQLKVPEELLKAVQETPSVVEKETITNIDEERFKSSGEHEISGTGSFDLFMETYRKHLVRELKEKRISGADYANAYVQLLGKAMDQAISFELQKDKAKWEGILAQLQAITASCQIYKTKVELAIAQGQALTTKAQYASAVAQLGILDAQYGNTLVQHDTILAQTENIYAQNEHIKVQNDHIKVQNDNIRAQTSKTLEDINLVVKQEAMVTQQTASFKRRDEYNAVKLQADSFTIQKSTDEGTVAPPVFQSAQINTNISKHLSNVGL